MKIGKWVSFLFFSALIFILFPNSFVSAHSTLLDTLPKGNEELHESPKSIEVWFKDPVTIHSKSIKVDNGKGKVIKLKAKNNPNNKAHIITQLQEPLPNGNYTININVIAPDGDVVSEKFSFTIKNKNVSKEKLDLKLIKASPHDGEITNSTMNKLDLWFNQPVQITTLGLFNDKKIPVGIKQPSIDPNDPTHVIIEFYENLNAGTYQISWFGRPLHEVEPKEIVRDSMGVYYFAVEKFTVMEPLEDKPIINWFDYIGLKQISYWLSFIGLCLLFGLYWFNKVIAKVDQFSRRWKLTSYLLFAFTIIGTLIFLTQLRAEVGDLSLREFFQLKFTLIPIIQIVLVLIGIIFSRTLGIFCFGIGLLIWPFVVGHSSYPRYGGWITMISSELHLFAVSIWMGGLFALVLFTPKNSDDEWLKNSAYKFSKWALASVIVITVTGIWMSINFIPSYSMESVIRSAFGRALLVKIALFFIMLIIAFSQRRLIKHLSDKLIKGFTYKLRTELLYGIVILFFASVLVVSTPSAAEQGVYPNESTKDGITLGAKIEPLFPGYSAITLDFNKNPDIESVVVTLSMPPDWKKTNKAFKVSEGTFKLTGMLLHAAGTVNMNVEAKLSDGDIKTFTFTVVVPGEFRFNE